MKNKVLQLLMLFCFACFGVARATVVTIGTGTDYSQNTLPVKSDWNYFVTQQIFTAGEIGTNGAINSISFNYFNGAGAFSMSNIQVYMKHVSKTQFNNSKDMVQVSPSDKVFDGTFSASGAGWVTINLDTPFIYDGSSNLLICFYSPVNNNLGSYINMFSYTNTENVYPGTAYYNHSSIDITNLASYNGYSERYNYRANIKIDIVPPTAIPYTYDFEDAVPFTDWNALTGYSYIGNYIPYTHSGTHYLTFGGSTSNIVVLPQFAAPTNTLFLKFWTRPENNSEACGDFAVGYMTNPSDASTFVALETYSHSDWTTDYPYVEKMVYFDNASANSRMAMRQYNCGSAWYWFVDDVKVNTIPTCREPLNAHIVEGSLIPNGVTIEWDAEAGEVVQYVMQPSESFNPNSINWSQAWQFNGYLNWDELIPDTDYTFGLRRYCSESDQSDPVFFTFHTPAPVPFNEPFATTSIPEGWTRYYALMNNVMNGTEQLSPVTSVWYFGNTNGAFNSDSHAYINIYGENSKHWLVTPVVHIENNCELSFKLALTQYYGTMQPVDPTLQPDDRFVVLASTDNGKYWTILREWNNTGSTYVYNDISVDGEEVIIDLTAYQGINLMVAFYGESTVGNNGDNNLHIDNVSINYIPDCRKPTHVEAIVSDNVATITWDAPENHIRWDVSIEWAENNDYPPQFTVYEPSITLTKEQLDEILDHDCYGVPFTAYVQGYCGSEDGWSNTSEEVAFTMLPPSLTVYDGTATNNTIPAYIYYFDDFTRSQFVIPADDLVEMIYKPITSMTFYTYNSNIPYTTVSPADVFLKEVDYTTINAFESQSSATNVYSGTFDIVSTGNGGEMTINFSTPYYYQGGNLLVGIENTDDEGYKNIYFYGQEVNGASISGTDRTSLENVQPSQQNFIPKTTFYYLDCTPKSLPYSYGFEDPDEFDCWTKLNCHTESVISNETAYEGNNSFRFRWNTNPPQYLISPKLDVAVDMKVSFYYINGSDFWPETFQVGYSTTTKSPDAFVWGDEVTANDENTWMLYEEIFPAGTKYVAVKLNSNDKLRLYLDNFSFEPYLCPDEQQCELTFTLTDSFGDTWNGNAIRVVDVQTNAVIAIMTNDYNNYEATGSSGAYTQTKTLHVCNGRELRFEWVSGNWPSECSYTVTDINESVVLSGSGEMGEPVYYMVNCSPKPIFITDGFWNDGSNWNYGVVPEEVSDVIIRADVVIPAGYTAYAYDIALEGGSITIDDGGQLWHLTSDLVVTMNKNIQAYGDANNQNHYYLLASPFNEDIPVPEEMTAEGCDLYTFNKNKPNAEWRNSKQESIDELLQTIGYLFASPDDFVLSLTGSTLESYNYGANVSYSENPNSNFNGWLLWGNFLTCNIYVYTKDEEGEYVPMEVMVYNEAGEKVMLSAGPIPPMSGYFIKLTESTSIYFRYHRVIPEGVINSKFTVNSNGDQVYFSQGNLQYIGSASTPYWKFADNQWEIFGNNGQGSTNQNVDRDLFGWGTSGYNHGAVCYQPWSTSAVYADYRPYGSTTTNLYDETGKAEWGYNAISNGGNAEHYGWRTMKRQEWIYVFNQRTTPSGIRYAKAIVNGVKGMVLLPDDWDASYYSLNSTNTPTVNFTSNTISASQWSILEEHGAVFLPESGWRSGTDITALSNYGTYWSSEEGNGTHAGCINFNDTYFSPGDTGARYKGQCVRLVFPAGR